MWEDRPILHRSLAQLKWSLGLESLSFTLNRTTENYQIEFIFVPQSISSPIHKMMKILSNFIINSNVNTVCMVNDLRQYLYLLTKRNRFLSY